MSLHETASTDGAARSSGPVDLRSREGIALIRNDDGSVRRMIWNEAGMSVGPVDEAFFLGMVRTGDAEGIARLLEATHAAAFVGSLDVDLGIAPGGGRIAGGLIACRFGPDNLLLVGTSNRVLMVRLLEPLMELAFEDASQLRLLLREARDRLAFSEGRNKSLAGEAAALRGEVERLRAVVAGSDGTGWRRGGAAEPAERRLGLARRPASEEGTP